MQIVANLSSSDNFNLIIGTTYAAQPKSPLNGLKQIATTMASPTLLQLIIIIIRFCSFVVSVPISVERDSVENVTAVCHGIVMGVEMPFPLPNPNGCVDSGLECPLNKEKSYAYVATLPVLKAYPKVGFYIRLINSF